MPEELEGEFILDGDASPASHKKSKATFYSSLCVYPTNVHFENQEEDEEIILLIRRDLITNVPWIALALFLALVPFIVSLFSDLITPFFHPSPATLLVILLFYYLVIFGFILVEFSIWYFTVGLVTNKRIIDLDLMGILSKHVSETKINLIEDVSYTQVGSIRSIFNYGDVLLQTAGTLTNFEFDRAPEPARIVRIIADRIGKKIT